MSDLALGYWSLPALLLLIFLRLPIGVAMFTTGFVGLWLATGSTGMALARLKSESFTTFANYNLTVIPMFLLMGQLAAISGLSSALFRATSAWLGHLRGGLGLAALGATAGFGAICGSSLATAATMGRIALPELRREGYAPELAAATLAAGGTLGILIPPSVILVIFAMLTEGNVGDLFVAAILPGLLAMLLYMGALRLNLARRPESGPALAPVRWAVRGRTLLGLWQVALVFLLVIGGIYGGFFTPTEAAALGAFVLFAVALFAGRMTLRALREALVETARSSAMIYLVIFGAAFYNGFLAMVRLPQELTEAVATSGLAPLVVLALVLLVYLLLGCVMDSLSMILLTLPVVWPLLSGLDFGMAPDDFGIWFGILVLSVVEIGLVTPPVGLNLFIIQRLAPDVKLHKLWGAMVPYLMADMTRVALLFSLPVLSLLLLR